MGKVDVSLIFWNGRLFCYTRNGLRKILNKVHCINVLTFFLDELENSSQNTTSEFIAEKYL